MDGAMYISQAVYSNVLKDILNHIQSIGGWIFVVVVLVLSLLFSIGFSLFFSRKGNREIAAVIISSLQITFAMLFFLILPLDVYSVSKVKDYDGEVLIGESTMQIYQIVVRWFYYVFFVVELVLLYAILPLSYFFLEEDPEETLTNQRRIIKTVIFVCISCGTLVIFLVSSVVFSLVIPHVDSNTYWPNMRSWVNALFEDEDFADEMFSFMFAAASTAAYSVMLCCTPLGLSAFPALFFRYRGAKTETISTSTFLENENAINTIETIYDSSGLTRKGRMDLLKLKRKRKSLNSNLDEYEENSLRRVLKKYYEILLIPIGIILAVISLFIVITLVLSVGEKFIRSVEWTGPKDLNGTAMDIINVRGAFTISRPVANPLDYILVFSSMIFPLDLLLVVTLYLFLLICSISALSLVEIRFFSIKFFKISFRDTNAQGLVILSSVLTLVSMGLLMNMGTLSPQYSMFGSQRYETADNSSAFCDIEHAKVCFQTQFSSISGRMNLRYWILGLVFYLANWMFIVLSLIGIVVVVIFKLRVWLYLTSIQRSSSRCGRITRKYHRKL